MLVPQKIARGKTKGCWSVCLLHQETGRTYWLDVSLDSRWAEFEIDWNQYIFYLSDPDDVARKEFQENCDNFEEAADLCVQILEEQGEVFHGEDGDWYLKNEEWEGEKTWTI
jgi:hypothetical protein